MKKKKKKKTYVFKEKKKNTGRYVFLKLQCLSLYAFDIYIYIYIVFTSFLSQCMGPIDGKSYDIDIGNGLYTFSWRPPNRIIEQRGTPSKA